MTQELKYKLSSLPQSSGCYFMKQGSTIIYIGKAKNLKSRVNSYFVGSHNNKTTMLVQDITDIDYIIVDNDKEAFILEINLIKKHRPKYNILLVDDKSYPYIEITAEKYPLLKLNREVKQKHKNVFGPYPTNYSAYYLHKILNEIYPFRKCETLPKKECIYYHLHQCLAPCIHPEVDYAPIVNEVVQIMKGSNQELLSSLQTQMLKQSELLNYELALKIRDLIEHIKLAQVKQVVESRDSLDRDVISYANNDNYLAINILMVRKGQLIDNYTQVFSILDEVDLEISKILCEYYLEKIDYLDEILISDDLAYEDFRLFNEKKIKVVKKGPKFKLLSISHENALNTLNNYHLLHMAKADLILDSLKELSTYVNHPLTYLEIFDNAHLFGVDAVSSVVVFKNNSFSKKDYRKFHLKTSTNDDLKSLSEVIYRRYFRLLSENSPLPDLVLVDGGTNQVQAAQKVLESLGLNISVLGLVKNENHKLRGFIVHQQEIKLDKNSSLFKFLLSLSEEVHRFTINFHRQVHQSSPYLGILTKIKSIGPITKNKLLKRCNSLSEIKALTDDELVEIGLNKAQITQLRKGLKYYD
ncbi:MAG: excinuclease ABC subunit UvrC [Acholeplasmatales bacterium]|jgi:excinuclease ABC subunit C|nr:excinuclease ABC subunit UvrC [Acholeplasmatales bacterium]